MSDKKLPWWVSGPPGTGKTRGFIKRKYKKFISEGIDWNRIVVLSHTVNAAKEILKAVKEIPEMKKIPDDVLEEQICTIHSYFHGEGKKRKVFGSKDHRSFCKENYEMNFWRFDPTKRPSWDKHPLHVFISRIHGKRIKPQEHWITDHQWYVDKGYKQLNVLNRLKDKLKDFKEKNGLKSYEDMIDDFIFNSKEPTDIDVLIVDEAQDCNVPQVEALLKAATNVDQDKFFFVGDKDQSIYGYSGAHNNFFTFLEKNHSYKFNEDEEPLEQGHRCGDTINRICKNIINPQRKKLNLSEKIWLPKEDVIGNHYWVPRLNEPCSAMATLIKKILTTKETFLFTYRGNPTNNHTSEFLQKHGIDYKIVSNEHNFISRKILRCFDTYDRWYNDEVPLKQIKEYWPFLPGTTFKVRGKGNVKEAFQKVIDGNYNIKQLHAMGLVTEEALQYKPFHLAVKNSDDTQHKKIRQEVNYIKKVLKHFGIEEKPRVEHDNIHKIKGLTYDNVVVNLSVYNRENDIFESERLGYVGYSRGITDCWTIGAEMFDRSDRFTSLGGIQHDRRRIFSIPTENRERSLERQFSRI